MRVLTELESLQIMRKCPRSERCSVPICPLDLLQDYRDSISGEPKCGLSKAKRLKIAEGTDLERQGMTKLERAAHIRWQRLSESEKERRNTVLRQNKSNYTGNFGR